MSSNRKTKGIYKHLNATPVLAIIAGADKPEQNESPENESPDIDTASGLSLASLQTHISDKLQLLGLDDESSESAGPQVSNRP